MEALRSSSNCQAYREPVLFRFNVQYGWKVLLSALAFICEFYCQSLDQTFRNRHEAFNKMEELFMKEMKENRFLRLQLLRLVTNEGHFNSGKEKAGKIDCGDYVYLTCTSQHKRQLDTL